MVEYVNEALAVRALIAEMKTRLGVEPDVQIQTTLAKMLRATIAGHQALAPKDYMRQLLASVEAVQTVYNLMVESAGTAAALISEELDPIASKQALQ